MLPLYRTLSLRYLSRRWFRASLIVASIALGVATLVATRTLNDTMARAVVASSNPLAGIVDLVVNNGELRVARSLAKEVAAVPGVKKVQTRSWGRAKIKVGDELRAVMVLGVDLADADGLSGGNADVVLSPGTAKSFITLKLVGGMPAVLGKELAAELPAGTTTFEIEHARTTHELSKAGTIEGHGNYALLSGYVIVLDQDDAAEVLGYLPGQVNRLDVLLEKGVNPKVVRQAIATKLAGRALVQTPMEQNQATGSAMAGFRTGFSLCGVAALIVGMFLVYNALSVTVAERRHEIGILLSLGATRRQIIALFAGEAALLGLTGALLGIPLGIGLATLGLQPVHAILDDVFTGLDVRGVDVTLDTVLLALAAGIATTVGAALWPAIQAAQENPADAVRRVAKAPTGRYLVGLLAATLVLLTAGVILTALRGVLPKQWGTFGGLSLVLVAALVASPLCATLAAAALRPFAHRFFPIAWRLAADNLLQSPGRTGMVIGALAAGVSLVMQTTGVIRSNRAALRGWLQDSIAADVLVTAGSAIGSGEQIEPMGAEIEGVLASLPEAEAILPLRSPRVNFRGDEVMLLSLDAGLAARLHAVRIPGSADIPLFRALDAQPDGALVSENFAARYGVNIGDSIAIANNSGPIALRVVGKVIDFSWALGTVYINRRDYLEHWKDTKVDLYDIYVRPGHTPQEVKEKVASSFGARYDLKPLTRAELVENIDRVIERVYGIAYGQQVVVMLVAALGVITSLLISVLQRRREMGLLRAVGAARSQVVHSVLAEACLMGALGTALGVLFGIPLEWFVLKVVILEESGFLFPVLIPWDGALLIAIAALATTTLAGLGPAIYAVRQRIPEAIAYE
jgi:putative ABC transport system permease protein